MVQPTVRCIRPSEPLSTLTAPLSLGVGCLPLCCFQYLSASHCPPHLCCSPLFSLFLKSLSFPFHVTHTSLLTTSMFVFFLMLSLQTKWQSYPVDRIIGILLCKTIGAGFFFKLSGLTASWKRGIMEYESHNLGNSCMFVIPKVFPTLSEGLKK